MRTPVIFRKITEVMVNNLEIIILSSVDNLFEELDSALNEKVHLRVSYYQWHAGLCLVHP